MLRLAVVAVDEGDTVGGAAQALEGLSIFWELGDRAATTECILCLAGAAAGTARAESAGRLLGAAERLFADLEIRPIRDFDTIGRRRLIQSTLGEPRAAAAFGAGKSLSFAGAVSEARTIAAEILTSAPSRAAAEENPYGLTPREQEVLALLVEELNHPEIAERLFISPRTVDHHTGSIYKKLDVDGRAAAVAFALKHGLVRPR